MSCVTPAVFAQTEGRVGVGGLVSLNATTDDDVGVGKSISVLVVLNPHKGWNVAWALNWFKADLDNPDGSSGEFARLRIRPLMGGVAYTIGEGRVFTSFGVVAGPSFNKVEFDDDFIRSG